MEATVSKDPLSAIRSWEPIVTDVHYETPDGMLKSETEKVVYRSDTMADIGSAKFVTPHSDICNLFDELLSKKIIEDVRCGVFDGGSKIWIQSKPSDGGIMEIVKGMLLQANFTFIDSYDNTYSQATVDSETNIACMNTYRSAYKNGTGIRIRHTSRLQERFAETVMAIKQSVKLLEKDVKVFRELAKASFTQADWDAAMKETFPLPERNPEFSGAMRNRNRLEWAYHFAPGAMPGTRLGAYQAMTYWLTHEAGRSDRFQSNLIGTAAKMNQKFLQHLMN